MHYSIYWVNNSLINTYDERLVVVVDEWSEFPLVILASCLGEVVSQPVDIIDLLLSEKLFCELP